MTSPLPNLRELAATFEVDERTLIAALQEAHGCLPQRHTRARERARRALESVGLLQSSVVPLALNTNDAAITA